MESEPAAPPQEPKKPSVLWKWIKRIGCTLFLLTLTCCGLTCTGGWWLLGRGYNVNKEEVDRLHADGMQKGDAKAMHDRADPLFRERFPLKDFEAFLEQRPGILDRANLHGLDFTKKNINGVEFVKIRSVPSLFSDVVWELVFKVVDGGLALVGISPGMDELVPDSFRFRKHSSRRHHRWFD